MTQFIAHSAVKIKPNRQRQEFKEDLIQELKTSIEESAHGLLHAPVLQFDGTDYWLVAGERRMRAIADIYALGGTFRYNGQPVPPGAIPYTELGDLSPADAWEAELEENIRRVDLTWQERAKATTEWQAMRGAQAKERGLPAPTVAQIAAELKPEATPIGRLDATRKELIVAKYLADPEVSAATSVVEAFKIVKKKEDATRNVALAAAVGKTFSSEKHRLINASAQEFLASDPRLYDIILSDPPYGMGADQFGDSGQGVSAEAHKYDDSPESWALLMDWFIPLTWAKTKPDAHMYLFCDIEKFPELKRRAEAVGWKVFRTPLIWHNTDGFRAPWPDKGPQRRYEAILYAVKGDRKVNAVRPDVLTYGKDTSLGHPAQKPVNLLTDLLRRSAEPGLEVLDAFCGSGGTIEAAHEVMCFCTAIELDPAFYGIAAKRLQSLRSEPALL